jgi:hypothetical protein
LKFSSFSDWEIVWDVMNKECRDEITLVEANCLFDTIENYLRKYKYEKTNLLFNSFFLLDYLDFVQNVKLKY